MADWLGVDMSDGTRAPIWKPIPGFDGYYVSDLGGIYSDRAHRELRPRPKGRYLAVSLYDPDGGRSDQYVHQIVAEQFLGTRPLGLEVRHRNDDRADNRALNLVYGTHSENMLDSVENGTHSTGSRTQCINGHEFTDANTYRRLYTSRDGTRRVRRDCRTCNVQQQRDYRARLNEK